MRQVESTQCTTMSFLVNWMQVHIGCTFFQLDTAHKFSSTAAQTKSQKGIEAHVYELRKESRIGSKAS